MECHSVTWSFAERCIWLFAKRCIIIRLCLLVSDSTKYAWDYRAFLWQMTPFLTNTTIGRAHKVAAGILLWRLDWWGNGGWVPLGCRTYLWRTTSTLWEAQWTWRWFLGWWREFRVGLARNRHHHVPEISLIGIPQPLSSAAIISMAVYAVAIGSFFAAWRER